MTRMQRLALALLTTAYVAFHGGAAFAQTAKDLVGTWQLVSNVLTQDGKKIDQFGPDPHGVLYFASNGRYVLSIVRDGLPKFAGNGRMNGTDAENKAIVQGSISHFGTYSVDGDKIVFHVEHATFPNWDGGTQARPFKLSGDDMSFFVAAASAGGGSSEVVWKRMK
jgi:lipocalin-like protein